MKVLKYAMQNVEPVCITDLHNSKSDEASVLTFINGASVRGVVMNYLADSGRLEAVKNSFFNGDILFLNALPRLCKEDDSHSFSTIPSPKGFYEDRSGKGEITHIFAAMDPAMKRAKVGSYAYLSEEDHALLYMSTEMGENFKTRLARNDDDTDLNGKKKKKEQKIFRGSFIECGHLFDGQIVFSDNCSNDLMNLIEQTLLSDELSVGGMRAVGSGRIMVETSEFVDRDVKDYTSFIRQTDKTLVNNAFPFYLDMMCKSGLCMLNEFGEPCGLNLEELAAKMGIEKVCVLDASSSVTHVTSFNRIYGGRSAEIPVFEGGSIFRLGLSAIPDNKALSDLEVEGLGLKREEGYGQVLFLKDIESYQKKDLHCKAFLANAVTPEKLASCKDYLYDVEKMERQCARTILKVRMERHITDYVLTKNLSELKAEKSQRGMILMLCKGLRYESVSRIKEEFDAYFKHSEAKDYSTRVYREKYRPRTNLFKTVREILDDESFAKTVNLEADICGLPVGQLLSDKDIMQYKLDLIEALIRYYNRSGEEAAHE